MNKITLDRICIMAMIAVLLLATGCVVQNQQQKFYEGTDGIVMDFYKSNPTTVLEGDEFTTVFSVKNMGTYSIPISAPATIRVKYDNYYLYADPKYTEKSIELHARDPYYPTGDEYEHSVYFKTKPLDSLRDSVKTKIDYNVCYPYKTLLTIMTCIDTRTSGAVTASACKAEQYSDANGQGAPIAITKIVPEMRIINTQKIVMPDFKIYLENKGKGYPFSVAGDKACSITSPAALSQGMNKVRVSANLSGDELVCEPKEIKLLDDRENYVRCHVADNNTKHNQTIANHLAPLTVSIDYTYIQTESQTFEIMRNQDTHTTSAQAPLCGAFEKEVNGKCISLCEYCASGANAQNSIECKQNFPTPTFKFDSGFGCRCTEAKCNTLSPQGKCITGYCTNNFCCKTDACDNLPDGAECGDNHVCINHVCSSTSQCDYLYGADKNTGQAPRTCMDISNCDIGTNISGLCPGNENNVCCIQNTCKDKATGTPCGDHHVYLAGRCSEQTQCDYSFGSQGYECTSSDRCIPDRIQRGLCPGPTDFVCCIPTKPATLCNDRYGSQGFICTTQQNCDVQTISYGGLCNDPTQYCCKPKI